MFLTKRGEEMEVKELIEILALFPDDTQIMFLDDNPINDRLPSKWSADIVEVEACVEIKKTLIVLRHDHNVF
jgi:hypothetical protein